MRGNSRRIKKLAKKVWKKKWCHKDITPNDYLDDIAGSCSFCNNARSNRYKSEGDISMRYCAPIICVFCLLPDYFCKQYKVRNLIRIINLSIRYDDRKSFDKAVGYIKLGLKALKKTGEVPKHLETEIKDYISSYYERFKSNTSKSIEDIEKIQK